MMSLVSDTNTWQVVIRTPPFLPDIVPDVAMAIRDILVDEYLHLQLDQKQNFKTNHSATP